MDRSIVFSLSLALAALTAGCSPNSKSPPTTPSAMLSPEQQRALDHWKTQLAKRCSWSDALGEPRNAPASWYADAAVMAAKQGSSPLVRHGNGGVAVLGAPSVSLSEHHLEQETTSAGGKSVTIRSEYDQGVCTVTLDGQELYRGSFVLYPILGYADADSVAAASATIHYGYHEAGTAERFADADLGELVDRMTAATAPSATAQAMLLRHFEADAGAQAIFPSAAGGLVPALGRVVGSGGELPFRRELAGSVASLAGLLAGANPGPFDVEWLYRLSPIDAGAGAAEGSPVLPLLSLRTTVQLQAPVDDGEGAMHAPASLKLGTIGTVDRDNQAAMSCFADLFAAAKGWAVASQADAHAPAADAVVDTCEPLASSFLPALVSAPKALAIVVDQALGAGTAPPIHYLGWDDLFNAAASTLFAAGKDLGATLTPADASPAVSEALQRGLGYVNALLQAGKLEELVNLGFGWMFHNLMPSPDLVAEVVQAVKVFRPDFADSTAEMLADLRVDIGSASTGGKALACAASSSDDHRKAGLALLARLDSHDPLTELGQLARGSFLQFCWSDALLAQLNASIDPGLAFADGAGKVSGAAGQDALRRLMTHTVGELWTSDSYALMDDVLDFLIVAPSVAPCASLTSRPEQALCVDSTLGLLSIRGYGLLDPKLGGRYGVLAQALAKQYALGKPRQDIADTVARSIYNLPTLWRTCSDASFAAGQQKLLTALQQLRATSESGQQDLLGEQIGALLSVCN
jgi:hypothetical protein